MSAIKRNLDDIIRKKLTEEIIAGEWVTGSLISIDDIMKRYGVSRTPVIQALKKMDAEGMVEFSSRGHFYVPDYEVKDVKDIVDVRTVLEEYAIRTIQEKGLEIDIIKLREISDEGLRSSADGDVIRVRECDLSFHRTLIEQAGNDCLTDLFKRTQGKFMMVNYLIGRHTALQQDVANADHIQVIACLEQKDYDGAIEILQRHIRGAFHKIEKRFDNQ